MVQNVFGPLIALSLIKHYTMGYKIVFIIGIALNAVSIIGVLLFYKPVSRLAAVFLKSVDSR